jgi:carboxylesterase type B
MSGTECLNLNITMPGLPSPTSSALPVMVFILNVTFSLNLMLQQ